MKVRRSLIAVVLVIAIVLASGATYAADGGRRLYKHNFITGTSGTKMNLKEDEPLTREQLAVLITELNGQRVEALQQAKTPKFSDAFSISGWARPFVAYCEARGWMTGVGYNLFDAKGRVTGKQLALVLLRAMDYNIEWKEVDALLEKLGVPIQDTPLTRGEAFDYVWDVITKPLCKNGEVLAVRLGKMTDLQISALAFPSVDLKVDQRGGKYGYVDFEGNVVIPYRYHAAHEFMGSVALVQAKESGRFALIDSSGTQLFGYELLEAQDQGDGLIVIKRGDTEFALIDYNGVVRIPFSANYRQMQYLLKDKLLHAVNDKDLHGLVTPDNEVVIPFVYGSMAMSFGSDGLLSVGNRDNTKYGAINRENETVIPFEYEVLHPFYAGKAIAKKNGRYGIIDKNNHVYLSFAFEEIYGSYADKYLTFRKGDTIGMIDKKARLMIPAKQYSGLTYVEKEDRVIARQGDLYGLLKVDGTELAPTVYSRIEEMTVEVILHKTDGTTSAIRVFLVEKDGKKGCMDLDGTLVVPLQEHDWEQEYDENDFTANP